MDAQAIITVSAAVVALTQLFKWGFIPDKYGPLSVILLSALGVGFWSWSAGDFSRATSFGYFAGWIAIATSAAGVFGFTRAGSDAVTKTSGGPPGAGAGKTNGFTSQNLKPLVAFVLASVLLLNSACGGTSVIRAFRAALESSQPLISSLVAAHVITDTQGAAAVQDFKDGADIALTLDANFKAAKGSSDEKALKLSASVIAMRGWRAVINRRNFQVSPRLTQAADIADGILSSLVVFYSEPGPMKASAESRATVLSVSGEKELQERLRVQVEQLKQVLSLSNP